MKINQIKLLIIAGFFLLMIAVIGFRTGGLLTAEGSDTDAAAVYKTKCAVCHSAKAEKFFDLNKPDEQHIEAILKGKKGAKPPHMPEFASKGVTPEQAKALTVYMRQLRTPGGANTNANANVNTNATVNANADTTVDANANANANSKANVNAVVNANANANTNLNAVVNKIPNEELAATYKAKCAMCHSPKAEKAYNPALPFEKQVSAILKGKKAAKPPHMPAFEGKGITTEYARALAAYMQSLRKPGS